MTDFPETQPDLLLGEMFGHTVVPHCNLLDEEDIVGPTIVPKESTLDKQLVPKAPKKRRIVLKPKVNNLTY